MDSFDEYTFKFDNENKQRFESVLLTLEDGEYELVQAPIADSDNKYRCKWTAILRTNTMTAFRIRHSMYDVEVTKSMSAEDRAREQERIDRHRVKVVVKVDNI